MAPFQPLNITDDIDKEECTSFLPDAIHVVDSKSAKRKEYRNEKFCEPWIIRSILIMIILSSAIAAKLMIATDTSRMNNAQISRFQDISLNEIQQWCLQPNVTTCKCANPLLPSQRHGHKTWTDAHRLNVKLAKKAGAAGKAASRTLDVVFLGDSIIEGWVGRSFGQPVEKKIENSKVLQDLFNVDYGGTYNGLALGIAGDKSSNLLWRLQNGEIPKSLRAKVYWILIGTNDFLKADLEQCSEDVVFAGIKRAVYEMMHLRPQSTIVVNAILPRSDDKDGLLYNRERKTVMDAIDIVNTELKKFCDQHDNLEYFDAYDIFVQDDQEGKFFRKL